MCLTVLPVKTNRKEMTGFGTENTLTYQKPLAKAPNSAELNSDTDCRFQIRKHSIGGSRGALAHKNSLLTKRREPKPPNPALASKKPYLTKSP